MAGFRPDYDGIGRMLTAEFMQAEMLRRAEKAKTAAEAEAPFDPNDRDGDHYRDHFKVESGVRHRRTSRAFGRLTNDHVAAVPIEYGTNDTPAHHTVLRSIDAMRD